MKKIIILCGIIFSSLTLWGGILDDLKIPSEKVKQIRNLADKIIKAGYPDAEGGKFYVGEIQVFSTIDPDKEEPPFPINTSYMQSTIPEDNVMQYGFKFDGPHVKLKDGTWLLEFYYPFKESEKNKIQLGDSYSVMPGKIYSEAQKKYPFDIREKAAQWVAGYPPDKKDYLCNIMNKAIPLTFYLKANSNEIVSAFLLLNRAGMKETPLMVYMIADSRSRDFWQLNYWSKNPGPFDPTGNYKGLEKIVAKWHEKKNNVYELEDVDVAFRRALHRLFRHMIINPDTSLSPVKAAKLAKLCLDPGDPQGIKKKIDMLLESVNINKDPGENAGLVEKLKAWGIPEKPEMVVTKSSEKGSPGISTMFISPKEAYTPDPDDLDRLFELLNDTRTTRFMDYQGSRDVGENALRAIAVIMKKNPLELVDMAEFKPWTPERRNTAVKKLQQWWKENRDEYKKRISRVKSSIKKDEN